MSRNLRQQARGIIFAAFRENLDKRAMKADGKGERNIFSYTSRNHLLDVINNFCNTVKDDIPRNPSELTRRHVRIFLDQKALEGCSQKTLDTYRSDLVKFGKLMGKDLDPGRVPAQVTNVTHRGAGDIISHDDLSKIISYAKSHPSRSGACIQLEKLLGIRVGDMAYGMKIKDDILEIKCKNGKILIRRITSEIKDILSSEQFLSMIHEDGRIITPKDNSINTYLRRVEDKLGIERHSFHSIRRRIAQDQYNYYREMGYTRTEALSKVSVWLNHGEKREKMILKSYIRDAW